MFEDVDEGHVDNDNTLHFHYNREERLKKAPQNVRDYYEGKIKPVKGFKVLFNKQNKFIFMSLILFVGFFYLHNGINKTKNFITIDDIEFELTAFSFEDEVFSTVTINTKKNKSINKPKNIKANFNFINNDNVVAQKEDFSLVYQKGEEYFRTKIPDYDIIRVDVLIDVDGKQKELFTVIQR